jgi:small conductance mechanosensitive channel
MKFSIKNFESLLLPWFIDHGMKIIFIGVAALLLIWISKKITERIVRAVIVSDSRTSKSAEKKREDTLIKIFHISIRISVIIIALLMILQEFGVMIGPILAGAGVVGLAVGFGGQYLIRDIITGLFVIMENQYRIGDVVKLDGTGGLVEDISLRMTTIRDIDGTVHHIPHGEIRKVSNLTKHFARVNLNIGVAYDSDLEHVIRVINETGEVLASDPAWGELIIKPPQFLRVDDFADSAIILKILGETLPMHQWAVAGEYRKRLKIAFDREQIEIPFPQRVIRKV